MAQRFLIALGSNRRHHRLGAPRGVIRAALRLIEADEIRIEAAAPIIASAPLGPSRRTYANSAALIRTRLGPEQLLRRLRRIEDDLGRCRRGQRWGERVIDLDIVLWSGGAWSSPALTIPHPAFRARRFVLDPAAAIAGTLRDPITGLTLRQLQARLTRPRPLPR